MTEELRVLMLVPSFPLNRESIKGGVHAAVLNLLLGFENQPVKVRLLSIDPSLEKDQLVQWSEKVEVCYCRLTRTPAKVLAYLFTGSALLKKQIRDFRPDVLHYQIGGNFLFINAFNGKKIPSLLTIHGLAFQEAKVTSSLKRKLTHYQNGMVTQWLRPRHIIHISQYSKALAGDGNNSHPVIYNAVSAAYFAVPDRVQTNNRLLFVGVIDERKNLLFLLKVLAEEKKRGRKFFLTVVGGPGQDKSYDAMVKEFAETELEGQVVFAGWRGQQEIPGLLQEADIMVLPSHQETLPMSVAEAMAAGKVVLASAVGGLPEMIRSGETGFLFPPDDAAACRQVLELLFNNDAELRRVAANARSSAAARFENHRIAAQTISCYKQIASGS